MKKMINDNRGAWHTLVREQAEKSHQTVAHEAAIYLEEHGYAMVTREIKNTLQANTVDPARKDQSDRFLRESERLDAIRAKAADEMRKKRARASRKRNADRKSGRSRSW